MKYRILVCGGRNLDPHKVAKTLEKNYSHMIDDIIVVHGGARGADEGADLFADKMGIEKDVFPADWKQYGKRAGLIRNREMLHSRINVVVAFPGGKGTQNMIDISNKAGKIVVMVPGDYDYNFGLTIN